MPDVYNPRYASLRDCLDDYARRFPEWKPDSEWVALLKDMHRLEEGVAAMQKRATVLLPDA